MTFHQFKEKAEKEGFIFAYSDKAWTCSFKHKGKTFIDALCIEEDDIKEWASEYDTVLAMLKEMVSAKERAIEEFDKGDV